MLPQCPLLLFMVSTCIFGVWDFEGRMHFEKASPFQNYSIEKIKIFEAGTLCPGASTSSFPVVYRMHVIRGASRLFSCFDVETDAR